MIWVCVAVFPQPSVSVHVLVNVYLLSHVPFVFTCLKVASRSSRSSGELQLSLPVNMGAAGTCHGQETVNVDGGGKLKVGASSSKTVITWAQVLELPLASV